MKHPAVSVGVLILIVAGAAASRLSHLDNRPMHTDEAVHGIKFGALLERGEYTYDPDEYHGPVLNYLTVPVARLGAAEDLSRTSEVHLRLVPAIFGIVLVAGLWLVRDALGRGAMLCAAVLATVSPAMIFYSRYYIQEMLLVCFTFFAIAALWRSSNRGSKARVAWLVIAGVCVGLMHATKETCIIAFFSMAVAGVGVLLFSLFQRKGPPARLSEDPDLACCGVSSSEASSEELAEGIGSQPLLPLDSDNDIQPELIEEPAAQWGPWRKMTSLAISGGVVLGVGAVVSVVLFSSLFSNIGGIADSITTYFHYFEQAGGQGSTGDHSYPWYNYLRIVLWWQVGDGSLWTEAAVAVLAVVGMIAALCGKGCGKASIPFIRFLCIYTVVMTVVYSAISYKTPWCLLGFLHGMILLAGVGASVLLRITRPAPLKAIVAILLVGAAGHLAWQGWRGNFPQCADPGNPYVYAHPTGDVPELARLVRDIAEVHPDRHDMHVQIICADDHPWPFPWYLRDFTRVDWNGQVSPGPLAPVIIYRPDLSAEVNDTLTIKMLQSPPYAWLGPDAKDCKEPWGWELRPYAPLHARVNRDLLKKYNASRGGAE